VDKAIMLITMNLDFVSFLGNAHYSPLLSNGRFA
jgi:hypothetical protein